MGLVTALGNDVRVDLGGPRRRTVGGAHDRGVRSVAADRAVRRRGARLRRRRPARPQGAPADRSLHPVRPDRGPRGARPGRPARAVRGRPRRADRGDPGHRPGRGRDADRRVHDQHAPRPRPDQPVPHPDGHPQHRRRPGRHPVRDDRPQLHHRVGLRDGRARARRIERDHPPRRRRRDGRRAAPRPGSTSRSSAASRRCARCPRGTTTRSRHRGRSTPGATGSSSARGPASSSSRRSNTPRRRGATILAELVGYGATADASHITLPAPGGIGAVRAARRALEKGGLTADEVEHVNAHATSTPEGDRAELQAIRTIFGDARRADLGDVQQVDARAHPRRGRARSRRSCRS